MVFQDLTGQRFGRLTVVERAPNRIQPCGCQRIMWKCKCDCGNVIITEPCKLKSGNTKSCGCLRKEMASQKSLKNVTGMRFGRLTVVRRVHSNARREATWLCKCDCGNEIIVSGHDLRTGDTKSCGCFKKDITSQRVLKDIKGMRFGKLTVVQRIWDTCREAKWLCRCDCGNKTIVSGHNLRTGAVRSCGCTASFGEEMARKILLKKSIKFSTQYKFNDLKSKHGYMLKFDFALQNKNKETLCLIEYQGVQHYKDHGDFGKQQREETDQLKRDYCKEHNIPLYEIRYDEDVEKRIDEILADIHYFDDKP